MKYILKNYNRKKVLNDYNMKLTSNPSLSNVKQLQDFVKDLPANSPFKMLTQYEQQLLDDNVKPVRAIVKVCDRDTHNQINKAENLVNKNWYRIANVHDIGSIPSNYFDIVLWSDCDPEMELINIVPVFPKLKQGGKIYIHNLDSIIKTLYSKCLPNKYLDTAIEKHHLLVDNLLKGLLGGEDHTIVRKIIGNDNYIVIVKGKINFIPSEELLEDIDQVDQEVFAEYPVADKVDIQQVKNKVFELIFDEYMYNNGEISATKLCELLQEIPSLPNCGDYGEHQQYLKAEYVSFVVEIISEMIDEIEANMGLGIVETDDIISELPTLFSDANIISEDDAADFIRVLVESKLAEYNAKNSSKQKALVTNLVDDEEDTDVEDEGEEESDEETVDFYEEEEDMEYPIVQEPKKLLPPIFLPGLANIGGYSCFMDSILFSILLPKKGYFVRHILEKKITPKLVKNCSNYQDPEEGVEYIESMQYELAKLANIIRGNQLPDITCYPIVQQLQKCNPFTEYLMSGDQQDDSEFLRALAQIFSLAPTKLVRSREVSSNKKDWIPTSIKTEREVILELDLDETANNIEPVSWYQKVVINDYNNVVDEDWPLGPDPDDESAEKRFRYSKEKVTIESSNALIFHAARRQAVQDGNDIKYVKNTTPIDFSAYIEKQDTGKVYELQTVTIHAGSAYGGHYTSYFKYKGVWYHYDDTKQSYERITVVTWDDVKKAGTKNGSLYMYFPKALK